MRWGNTVTNTRIVTTSRGPVEVASIAGDRATVLFFPGGHCSASCDCGWSLYTASGYGVLSFSRPGYGATQVGRLGPGEFAALVREVCDRLAIQEVAASVGVSFGGMQAVHVALQTELSVPRLVLHSCAPSRLNYPDTFAEAIGGRIVFSPVVQGLVWRIIHRAVRSEHGLRRMMARLSLLPVDEWWNGVTAAEKSELRRLFRSMRSGRGFVNDLHHGQAKAMSSRRDALTRVRCATLVTGSPHDGGVSFAHAADLAAAIHGAVLLEHDSPSHMFWIGPQRARLASSVNEFLIG